MPNCYEAVRKLHHVQSVCCVLTAGPTQQSMT